MKLFQNLMQVGQHFQQKPGAAMCAPTPLHKVNCAFSKDGNNDLSISPGIVPDLLTAHKNVNDAEFADILNRFRPYETGKLCQKNEFIITFGKYLFKKKQQKERKSC